jgi:hypothetical protein
MKTLCKYKGGSHSYGLADENSDIDIREVFINTDTNYILGLGVNDNKNIVCQNKENDSAAWEIRHFFNLLRKTNTQMIEILFLPPKYFDVLDSKFEKLVLNKKERFFDTKRFFKSVCGYLQGEKRRANGELTGRLGYQRQEAIAKYGFSPKNFSSCFRICFAAQEFFKNQVYIVNFDDRREMRDFLYDVKRHPENYNKDDLNRKLEEESGKLLDIFDNRDYGKDVAFDIEYANWVLKEFYKEYLTCNNEKSLFVQVGDECFSKDDIADT